MSSLILSSASINFVVCWLLVAYLVIICSSNDEGNTVDLKEHAKHFYSEEQQTKNGADLCTESASGDEGCVSSPGELPLRLPRLDGVKVGHVEELELTSDRKHYLHTINMKPLIFEIPDFFSAEECEHIIDLAKAEGLQTSVTHQITADNRLLLLDTDGDQKLSLHEMKRTIEDGYDIYLNEDDIREMYYHLKIDLNNDDYISRAEGKNLNVRKLAAYVQNLVNENPVKKSRFSEQAWIFPDRIEDDLVTEFQRRIQILTRLPSPLIDQHSYFQVVKYGPHGHYNAHLDSAGATQGLPCCHLVKTKKCRICRYMTIMVYLNDVEEGGETAFVVANNDTVSDAKLRASEHVNLYNYCKDSKLHVRPEKGKAVVWYNHFIDETTGWFGDVDEFTWHGGCPVLKGEKWIMNRWISASPDRAVDLAL